MIIDNVTRFSREQETGIVQINDTISRLDRATQENAMTASNIDILSKEVSKLSSRLLDITSQSKIDKKYYEMVEDINLLKEVSKYKNDHIITSPINNLNYNIIWDGKNRCKKIITKRVV